MKRTSPSTSSPSRPTITVRSFGIDPDNMFEFWDWVGGRYSLWSAIGLSLAIAVGMDRYEEMLEGAHRVDEHFRTTPFEQNIPVIMALLGIWYNNFFGAETHAILPYDQYWPASPTTFNRATWRATAKPSPSGEWTDYGTGPVIWGQRHQRTARLYRHPPGHEVDPCDFLAAAQSHNRRQAPPHPDLQLLQRPKR